MSPLPAISALVVTYQTGPRLHECLYALKGDADITEIILVSIFLSTVWCVRAVILYEHK